MRNLLIGVVIGVVSMVIGQIVLDYLSKINPKKVVLYLPYANDYFYANGRTYKGATASPEQNMPRNVDPQDLIPLNFKNGQQKLTLGVRNLNSKPIDDVVLFLILPSEFTLTKYAPWQTYTDKNCYIGLGNINSGMGHNDQEPIFFKVSKAGKYKIDYVISSRSIGKPVTGIITFDVFE